MTHKRITMTLPPELFAAVDQAAEREHRTRSQFIRVALLRYLDRPKLPEHLLDEIEDYLELNDPEAIRDIAISSREVREGKVADAEELSRELHALAAQSRKRA
jgi:predicted transcriptional regulator